MFALRASGPIGSVCVSTPQRLTTTPSSRMWKPRQRLFSKMCESCAQVLEQQGCLKAVPQCVRGITLMEKEKPSLKSMYLSVIVSMSPSTDHHTCLLYDGVWFSTRISRVLKPGCSCTNLLIASAANTGSCCFSFHFNFSIVLCVNVSVFFYSVVHFVW